MSQLCLDCDKAGNILSKMETCTSLARMFEAFSFWLQLVYCIIVCCVGLCLNDQKPVSNHYENDITVSTFPTFLTLIL